MRLVHLLVLSIALQASPSLDVGNIVAIQRFNLIIVKVRLGLMKSAHRALIVRRLNIDINRLLVQLEEALKVRPRVMIFIVNLIND